MTISETRKDRIARIAALPDALAEAVRDLSDVQLDARSSDDPWCVRQVIHHIADSHTNAFIRTKLIMTEDHPTLKPYNQDAWAGLPDSSMPIEASLAILRGVHARWIRVLESLGESDWERGGLHLENGDVTLAGMLETYDRHGQDHIEQIKRIVAATTR